MHVSLGMRLVCMCVCIFACVCAFMYVQVCMCVNIFVCACVCLRMCRYVCMCVHVWVCGHGQLWGVQFMYGRWVVVYAVICGCVAMGNCGVCSSCMVGGWWCMQLFVGVWPWAIVGCAVHVW